MKFDQFRDLKIKGFSKILHRLFLILTYPFRHPIRFLLFILFIIAVLIGAALVKGVSFYDIPKWYFTKIEQTEPKEDIAFVKQVLLSHAQKLDVPHKLQAFKKSITFSKVSMSETKENIAEKNEQKVQNKAKEEPVLPRKKYAVWNIQKNAPADQSSNVQSNTLKKEIEEKDITLEKEKIEGSINQISEKLEPIEIAPLPEKVLYRKLDTLGLRYLDDPVIISGEAIVYGPNELYVADTYLYLYGIYTSSVKYNASKAAQYLRELVDSRTLECHVVAYTADDIATAVCLIDGRSINQHMVDAGMADNIAL